MEAKMANQRIVLHHIERASSILPHPKPAGLIGSQMREGGREEAETLVFLRHVCYFSRSKEKAVSHAFWLQLQPQLQPPLPTSSASQQLNSITIPSCPVCAVRS